MKKTVNIMGHMNMMIEGNDAIPIASDSRIFRTAALFGFAWIASVSFGFWTLLDHDTASNDGESSFAEVVPVSLTQSAVCVSRTDLADMVPDKGCLHIVVAMHPKCPCTRTTLSQLERLLAEAPASTKCTFLVSKPRNRLASWIQSDTTDMAKSFANSEIFVDIDSERARKLGMAHSGTVLIVRPDGTLSFMGGITAGRSCSTENPGSLSVASLLRGESAPLLATPTFGCPLTH
ncbi:hypothetical protein Poly51_15140 [Rubripirellula tenax]|uniref:RedB protein n=1 Tax=Rubripirellula tenax TaxID=2528015 RepID=A0A5C6FEW2_9BACT|nr:hypothetical protein [Rubripirellula tenax]TWU58734.1 hypothetical protein Poly51_15140 [Rubripirellula tenax]